MCLSASFFYKLLLGINLLLFNSVSPDLSFVLCDPVLLYSCSSFQLTIFVIQLTEKLLFGNNTFWIIYCFIAAQNTQKYLISHVCTFKILFHTYLFTSWLYRTDFVVRFEEDMWMEQKKIIWCYFVSQSSYLKGL